MTRLFAIISFVLLAACSKNNVPANSAPVNPLPPVTERVVNVSTAAQLKTALLNAKPGDAIVMADGIYKGKFVIGANVSGTPAKPIILRGSRNAILDAENTNTGYVLHLQASYWTIKGFTLTNGLKGLVADGTNYSIIDSLLIHTIGEEGIHLRKFSSFNTIRQVTIHDIGLKTPDYGEGIYIGSAKNHWATYSNGLPDKCDSNLILNNHIGPGITAECIDVKEGTTGGIIRGNYFDATGISGANAADSWIDVKGNYTLIENNTGYNP
ncbi:MAG TPA: chondroitinase-B domain-containing protein, partial [Ferruginibacter sp.]|nr:chondroitinase-B domain-containing protein [Ferruginibacter sp.]